MTDEEFELHKAAVKEVGIAVEATLTGRADRKNGETGLSFAVHRDNQKQVTSEILQVGHSYKLVLFKLADNEQIDPNISQRERRKVRRSDSTVGTTPAPGGVSVRALSEEMYAAEMLHAKSIANKYNGICQARRNDPKYRGFLFDYFKTPLILEPVAAREWVKQKQHELLKVEHCSHIYPGTYAEKMFGWLESAFVCDRDNLPIPEPPGGTDEAG